jgi:hypothetical protein
MSCKFKYGDRVIANGHKGQVISVHKKGSQFICRVKFENRGLFPGEMDFLDERLSFQKIKKKYSLCPICSTEWTVTKFMQKEWKDCSKCNETYENIIEKHESPTPPPIPGDKSKEYINEFEKIVSKDNVIDDDDDDWNIFFD